jgi:histidinol-phosphate/aromatic aminotransferase/cobyric acid decarboxylase-like protein
MFIAMEAMKNDRQMKESLDIIKKERERMFKEINSKYTAVKSDANFIFLKLNNAKKAKFAFEKSGISIRMFSKGPAAGWARITVGKPAENTAVLKILKRGV